MKKEKNFLQEKFSAGEYLAPKIKVKELRRRGVICASDSNSTYGGFTNPEEEG